MVNLAKLFRMKQEAFVVDQRHFFDASDKYFFLEKAEQTYIEGAAYALTSTSIFRLHVQLVFLDELAFHLPDDGRETFDYFDIPAHRDVS